MDAISGWAGKMFLKQKMGSISDSLPGSNGSDKKRADDPFRASKQMRTDLKDSRVERDAEMERKKAERAEKKGSISDRWAANKKANS